ncbi:hypothetical protein LEP1GSC195_2899 [Leptospira wolbachii serovar Codice str. CDC]|uniref:Uncharacterized protein n=1 Tax=Leptospira wolbachii serovar Codice str. CDC TaxID=1218599 RepID=R9A6I0_9LEPT|nr:hypothetical protein LEP1GSC195_2899 [Leptospira wolbachii serovar Codice str. CDC]
MGNNFAIGSSNRPGFSFQSSLSLRFPLQSLAQGLFEKYYLLGDF